MRRRALLAMAVCASTRAAYPKSLGVPIDLREAPYRAKAGSNITEMMRSALSSTLNAEVLLPTGELWTVSGPILIPPGASISSSSSLSKAKLSAVGGSYDLFTFVGDRSSVRNVHIENKARAGGFDFVIRCEDQDRREITISDVTTVDSFGVVRDEGEGRGKHIQTLLRDITAHRHRGPGILFSRAYAFQRISRVVIDYNGSDTFEHPGFVIDSSAVGGGGMMIVDCNVSAATSGSRTDGMQHGMVLSNTSDIWLSRTLMDCCGGTGFAFSNLRKLHINASRASLCNGVGFRFVDCAAVTGGFSAFGRRGMTSTPSTDGVQFVSGCYSVALSSVVVRDFTGHGINKLGAQAGSITIGALVSQNNQGRGVFSRGDSAFNISGGALGGNQEGNYDIGGVHDYLTSTQLDSGALVTVGPGPTSG
jgi:hypothetical protein